MQSNRYFCAILIKLEYSRHVLEKFSKIKYHENPNVAPCIFSVH